MPEALLLPEAFQELLVGDGRIDLVQTEGLVAPLIVAQIQAQKTVPIVGQIRVLKAVPMVAQRPMVAQLWEDQLQALKAILLAVHHFVLEISVASVDLDPLITPLLGYHNFIF